MWGRALRRFAREKLHAGPRRATFACEGDGSGVDEVIAKTMASALFLSKSMRHSSARGCVPELSVRIRHRSFLLGGTLLCGGAGQTSTGGFFPVDDTQAGEEAPTTFAVGNNKAGLQTRANN